MTRGEQELVRRVIKALAHAGEGDPLKDYLDQGEIVSALTLLVKLAKEGK